MRQLRQGIGPVASNRRFEPSAGSRRFKSCPRNHLYLLNQKPRPPSRGFFVRAARKPQDRRQFSPHLHPKPPVVRHEHDRVDEAADQLPHGRGVVRPERSVQLFDLASVGLRDAGMQPWGRRGGCLKFLLEFEATPLELLEFLRQAGGGVSVGDSVDQPVDLPADAVAFRPEAAHIGPGLAAACSIRRRTPRRRP